MTLTDILKLAREAKERAEKATPGPWTIRTDEEKPDIHWTADIKTQRKSQEAGVNDEVCWGDHEMGEHHFTNPDDADFIAASRTDVPELCRAVEVLAKALELAIDNDLVQLESQRWDTVGGTYEPNKNYWIEQATKELEGGK